MVSSSSFSTRLIMGLMLFFQSITLLGVGTVTIIQPTPAMVQDVVQHAGLNGWLAHSAVSLTEYVQPLFGVPKSVQAQSAVPAVVNASPDNVSFGSVSVGSTSVTQTVTIANIANPGSTISGGGFSTCAVTSNGGVKCWGWNGFGQLGDGTNINRTAPTDVIGLQTGVVSVQNSYHHTCALTANGGVKCWGYNGLGQLGDGSTTSRNTPVDVKGLTSGVLAIAVGQHHTCALTNQGSVMCWGYNALGQLGDAGYNNSNIPVAVNGLTTGASAITAGEYFSCALTTSGGVKCWGYGGEGQLGNADNSIQRTPVDVSGLTSGMKAIGSGQNWACAVTTGGAAKCWGYNGLGQLGNGSNTSSNVPVNVSSLSSGVSTIEGGLHHTCALTTSGGVKCWGFNSNGQLGDGGTTTRNTPADVTGLTSGVSAIGLGYYHSCAVTSDGGTKCWGRNGLGELGDGYYLDRYTPNAVDGQPVLFATSSLQAASAGGLDTCAITADGGVKCWGYNDYGQLGDGTYSNRSEGPRDVVGLSSGVTALANNYFHTCALTSGGGVKCWGYNGYGQLGYSTAPDYRRNTPTNVTGLTSGVTAIATGEQFSCALTSSGGVKCWGQGNYGQLGNGSTSNSSAPVDVTGLTSGVSAIAAGDNHACAALSAGGVKCWGYNGFGQLGNGGNSGVNSTPVTVSGLTGTIVTALAGDYHHTCALTNGGGVKCWGDNGNGQLGDGSTTHRNTPVDVSGLTSGVTAIDTGYHHTCALTSGGGAKCWGYNGSGQVGDNTSTQRTTPVNVSGLTSGVTSLAVGRYHSCAIINTGDMKCWGYDSLGQLGDGSNYARYKPATVSTLISDLPDPVDDLSVTEISLSGVDASDFSVVGGSCGNTFPITLTQGTNCTVLLKANPSSTGTSEANLTINSSDSAQSIINVPLDVTTADPDIDVSPESLNFGNVNLGVTSPAQLVTIRNVAPAGGVMRSGPTSAHTCAVTDVGGVKCWGYNNVGQLGDGTQVSRYAPVDVTGLISGVTSLAVGNTHTCALTTSGGVKCWGYNNQGQLGYSTTPASFSALPQDVPGLASGVNAIAAGSDYTCALLNNGGMKCWGLNNQGQLGTGSTTNSSTPVDVSGLTSGVSAIAAGESHTCAILGNGGMKCWGLNNQGQLGAGSTTNSTTPVDVSSLTSGVSSMALGRLHSCAVTESGGAKCWGYNNLGQLGDGTTTNRATPTDVSSLTSGVTALAAGEEFTCALLSSGGAKCWGYNAQGQLGDGGITTRSTPADVLGLTKNVDSITAGQDHACVTTSNGGGTCWGYNNVGQLGNGTTRQSPDPTAVVGQPYLFATTANAAAAGGYGSCAVTANKGAKCWGNDEYWHVGVGDGNSDTRYGPVDVSGLLSGTAQLATARYHACAVLTDGSLKCWGLNNEGQLGDGSTTNRQTPTDVSGFGSGSGGSITNLSGGYQSSCALTSAGGIKCWGWNGYGQLGEGSTNNRYAPTAVTGITSGSTAVENGTYHSCAIVNGGVKCWGYNGEGQLGDSTNSQRTTPVDVTGLGSGSGVTAIATGHRHSCAITSSGAVKCWGWNGNGQLGDGTTSNSNTPVDVSGLSSGVTKLAVTEHSTCALLSSGAVKCWGYNGEGQLGNGSTTQSTTPVDVSGLSSGVTAIEGGEHQSFCALTSSGGMKCWGYNGYGQLGDGSTTRRLVPTDVSGLTSSVTAMKAGRLHTCAIVNGGMKCWGYNGYGQLGDGSTTQRLVPTDVSGLTSGVTKLAAGEYYSCALVNGVSKCWGYNGNGQLGDGSTNQHVVPTDVAIAVSGVAFVATSQQHSCALTTDGAVKCWGSNAYGQLGDGTTTQRNAPVQVTGLTSNTIAIAVGENFSCALLNTGNVKCWGRNSEGRLGDGTVTNRTTPVDVSGLTSGVSAIGAGDAHACAALTSGGVKCWGYNDQGQLGSGNTTLSNVPVDVSGLSSTVVTSLRGGYRHTCALTSDGGMKCWGYNNNGQLGNGNTTRSLVPIDVNDLTSGVASIAVGHEHSCAILNTGHMKCWGYNGYGQAGDGTNNNRTTPNEVATLLTGIAGSIGALNVTDIALSGGDSGQFAIASGGSCSNSFPFSLASGASCTVPVTFGPTSYGGKNANLVVSSNDPLSPTVSVALSGTAVGPELKILKSGPANAVQGTNFNYTVVVSNTGNSATSGTITVSDTLASDLSFVSGSGSGFACSASGQDVTCTSSTSIAVGGSATINLTVTPTGLGTLANSANVAGAGDLTVETSDSANTNVGAQPPDLTTVIGQPTPDFVATISSTIPITISNIGSGATSGVISATIDLPLGTTAPITFTDGTWSCSTSGQTVTCLQPNLLLPGESSTVNIPVTPDASTIGTQPVFDSTVFVPVETVISNNDATPMTSALPVAPAPVTDLIIGKSGPVTATQGSNFDYRLTITNTGSITSSGTITVSDALSTGVSFVSGSGSGFTCSASGQNVTCTGSATLALSDTSAITLTVNPTTVGEKVNSASVIGGGDSSLATSNLVTTTVSAGDTTAPTTTVTSPVTGTVTNDNTPTIRGTGEPGSTVTVTVGSQTMTTTVPLSGNWVVTPTSSIGSDGTYTPTVSAVDAAGNNYGPVNSNPFTLDTALAAPSVTAPAANAVLSDTTPTISGTGEPGSTVTVTVGSQTMTATVPASGNWVMTPTSSIGSDGVYTPTVTASDAAGNVNGPVNGNPFTLDTTVPTAPTVTAPISGTTTADNTPTLSGTAEPTSTVTVKDSSGNTLCTTTTNAAGNWSCETTTLPTGANNLSVSATDAAGNSSAATPWLLNVNSTTPTSPLVTAPVSGTVTNDATPTITGTAQSGVTVTVKDAGGSTLCTTTADGSGNWSCTTSSLPEGSNPLRITATNNAGTESPATPYVINVDTTAPTSPVLNAVTASGVTTDTTPTISGTAEPSATVTVKEGSTTLCTTTTDASGNWSCNPSTPLSEGAHTISATATDAAGNSSPAATPATVTIDTTAPSAPTVTSPTAGSVISDTTPTISGTVEPTSTLTVKDAAGNPVCTTTTNASGNWSCTTSTLTPSSTPLSVIATDPAGNTSTPTSLPLTIDTTAPSAPTVTSPTAGSVISDMTPTISGTAEPTSTVTVKDAAGNPVCTTTTNASGNWSCTTSTLTPSSTPLSVTATDPAGNSSTPTSLPLTIDTTAPSAPTVTAPISGTTTTDNTPTISGTAEANSTITIKDDNGNTVCTTTANASGNWSCTSSTLPEGANDLTVIATDPAGNSSPALPLMIEVDTTAPATPTIASPAANSSTNDATPIITGTAEAGSTVVIKEGSTTLCTTVADSSGNWQCVASTPLSSGTHIISATSSDAAGNSSTSAATAFTVDAIAPAAPSITSPTENQSLSDSTPTITGTAEAGSTVVVKEGDTTLCSAVANSSGSWSCTVTTPLAEGAHTITATATDPANNVSAPTARNLTVDSVPPTAPTVTAPVSGTTTNDNTPIIGGTAEPGTTIVVKEGSTTLCTTVTDGTGRWQCAPSTTLSDGAHTVTVTATDSAGNSSPSTSDSFIVDTVAPAQPIISAPAASSVTSDTTPLITGTAEVGVTVTVKEGSTTLCTAVADGAGNWSCTPSTPLGDGNHTVLATASDAAGNSSLATPSNFTVDSVAPVAPAVTQPSSAAPTNDNTPAIGGTAEPGALISVSTSPTGTLLCSAVADGVGNWSCSPVTTLPDGTTPVVAIATDAAGNTSPVSQVHNITVDTASPAIPVITAPAEGSTTTNSTPTVRGTAEPGSTVTVSEGGTTLCMAMADVTGTWSCATTPLDNGSHAIVAVATDAAGNSSPFDTQNFTVNAAVTPTILVPTASQVVSDTTLEISGLGTPSGTVTIKEGGVTLCTTTADALGNWSCSPSTPLSEGSHAIVATVTDSGGGSVSSAARAFTVDSQPPAAATISAPTTGSSTGDSTPTISGKAEPGSSVEVSDGGTPICTAVADGAGNWSCTPSSPLSDGEHNLAATATDAGGNTGASSTDVAVTIDTVAPVAPVVSSPAPSSILSDTTPTLTGTAEPGSTVNVKENGTTLCTATVDSLGNWSCTPAVPLGDGNHTFSVTATDPTGNPSAALTLPVTIDSSAPTAPAISAPTANSTTADTTPTLSGTGEPNATVAVSENGSPICSAVVDNTGNWSCTPSSPLGEGAHSATAEAVDRAGNHSLPTTRPFTVDSTAPNAPTISVPVAGSEVNDNTPTLRGTAEPGSSVEVSDGGTPICTAVADGAGNWSCTPSSPLSDGNHNLSAEATDAVGNSSSPSVVVPITFDTVAPATPTISSPANGSSTSDNTPTIRGTAEPSSTVTVKENGVTLCTATTDASGNWSCTSALALANGSHTILATASDAAGNSSGVASSTLTVNTTAPAISSPAPGAVLSDTTPTVTGVGIPGGVVTVTEEPAGTPICTATVDALGNWSCTAIAQWSAGSHTLEAMIMDAGGTQTTAPVTFLLDGSAPTTPVVTAPAENAVIADSTPLITGTADPNSTVTVKENGATLCSALVNSSGSWSCVPASPLSEGPHTIQTTATDAAGNVSVADTQSFTVDTLDPMSPTIITPANGSGTEDATPSIGGFGEPGSTVTVSEGGATLCTATVNSSGQWSCTPATLLNDGSHTLLAVATDAAGNSSTPAVSTVTVDTSAPTAPAITKPISGTHTSSTSPLLVGTAEPGALVTVMEGATVICSATANSTGNWNCAPSTPLSAGEHSFTAIASDSVGNDSPASPAVAIVVEIMPPGDSDGDGLANSIECPGLVNCADNDGDGTPDYLDPDSDGDGIADATEGTQDSDNDGIPNRLEDNRADSDGDGILNPFDADDDGDGIPTKNEDLNSDSNWLNDDADGDGIPAYLDPNDATPGVGDSDGDGIPDAAECPNGQPCPDSDGDGLPDYADSDSDGDGIADATEGTTDSDGDGIPNRLESSQIDSDGDGQPNQNDADDDGDGIPTADEDLNHDGNFVNDDKDGDGIPAYLDPNDSNAGFGDSDGDGIDDKSECPGGNRCPDSDSDGQPDYLDTDSDGDGTPDASEGTTDSDSDGVPNRLEPSNVDSDGDATPNQNDADDDGDGIPTADEDLNDDGNFVNDDKDGDGIPAYLDPNDAADQPNGGDSDGDGIKDSVECSSGNACPDSDGDGQPDYLDTDSDVDSTPDATEGTIDSDGDGIPNRLEPNNLDSDGDGKPNQMDSDDDGDGIPTADEDLNDDGNFVNDDTDGDGIPAYLDPNDADDLAEGGDSDGDGISDASECPAAPACPDTDGDDTSDYADTDSDGDGNSDASEGTTDSDNDGIPNRLEPDNGDTDGDGLSNQNDADDDGDGIPTADEDLNGDGDFANDDKDGDGIPAYLDPNDAADLANGGDSDGDGIPDAAECPTGTPCPDTNGDGQPDYLDSDSDGDGTPDQSEGTTDSDSDGIPNRLEPNDADTDGDGTPNQNDADDDGDGIPTASEDLNRDGNFANDDKDGDGIPAYLDPNDGSDLANGGDSDGDGIDDATECPGGAFCIDTDGDGTPDYLDKDADGDGILDSAEGSTDSDSDGIPDRLEPNNVNTDGDGLSNQNDDDDDGDGIPTASEDLNGDGDLANDDKDGDGIPAYLDPNDAENLANGGDSDGDGISDTAECGAGAPCADTDGDGQPDYLDKDSDGDGTSDQSEGTTDSDSDGIPNRLEPADQDTDGDGLSNQNDADDDGDGIPTASEDLNGDGNFVNDDTDGDGIPAYLDPNDAADLANGGDSDGDGINDASECLNSAPCPDSDGDGTPDYLDKDSDNDGLPDSSEGSTDSDGDGIPNRLEANNVDTDGDGVQNQSDADDDGDGIPTADEELNGDGNFANDDTDGDGIPAYLDPNDAADLPDGGDSDGDGITDATECPGGVPCPDTNGDGQPDYLDPDSDGDGIPDASEGTTDSDNDGIPNRLEPANQDTDGDGLPNQNDADDDGDSIPTLDEDLNDDGNFANDDKDGDGIPAYLDPNDAGDLPNGGDSDGDGVNDAIECSEGVPCSDSDGDGQPDYLDKDSDGDGILDEVEGANDGDNDGVPDRLESAIKDTDGDGKPNQNDADDDDDGIPTKSEDLNHDGDLANDDKDGDGIPAYLDPNDAADQPNGGDSDGDGILDEVECPTGAPCPDTNGDGQPDYLDSDSDGDGTPDQSEGTTDSDGDGLPNRLEPNNVDTDGDGTPNQNDADDDGDGIPTKDEDLNGDGNFANDDKDGDGIPAYLDPNDGSDLANGGDSDGDGINDATECPSGAPCPDSDGDGRPDYVDDDTDNDGIKDAIEGTTDSDQDGKPDYLDPDDDNDGVLTKFELNLDSDNDSISNHLDTDDDGDGKPTLQENADGDGNGSPDDSIDQDEDGVPDYLDPIDNREGGNIPRIYLPIISSNHAQIDVREGGNAQGIYLPIITSD